MKIVKPSVYSHEGLSTGVNMDASAPHLIHKWLNESRQSPSLMLLAIFFLRPTPLHELEIDNISENCSGPPHCRASGALKILRKSQGAFRNCVTF